MSLVQVIVQLPIAFIESLVFSMLVYWLTGLYVSAGNFFWFWLQMFLSDMVRFIVQLINPSVASSF